jgi:hypothetical protein
MKRINFLVFYSVLVAQASLFDWITTVCAMIAVTTGLSFTIFLLVIKDRPIPALPISIIFGIVFYFVANTVLSPMIFSLVDYERNGSRNGQGFVENGGAGLMYL